MTIQEIKKQLGLEKIPFGKVTDDSKGWKSHFDAVTRCQYAIEQTTFDKVVSDPSTQLYLAELSKTKDGRDYTAYIIGIQEELDYL